MNVAALVQHINAQHETTFVLLAKLPGGQQDGAYLLADARRRQAVLKRMFAPRALPIMRRLHAAGYATPAVLYTGMAPDGTTYLVQELLAGAPLKSLEEPHLDRIFALNDLQADLNPHSSAGRFESWSQYAYEAVFAERSILAAALPTYSAPTASLLDAIRRATAGYRAVVLPDSDAVHGDFRVGNILAEGGRVTGVIDLGYAGYGTRALDLATLLHDAYGEDYGPAVRDRLAARIVEIAGPAVCAICLAYRVIVTVEWAIRNRKPEMVGHFVRVGWAILGDLAADDRRTTNDE
jgi:aminoglycoside phosphotransferase (APT) family kinase protein